MSDEQVPEKSLEEVEDDKDIEEGMKKGPKRIKKKINETNRDTRIISINKLAKEFRPLGKVVAIINSPNSQKELLATLQPAQKSLLKGANLGKNK